MLAGRNSVFWLMDTRPDGELTTYTFSIEIYHGITWVFALCTVIWKNNGVFPWYWNMVIILYHNRYLYQSAMHVIFNLIYTSLLKAALCFLCFIFFYFGATTVKGNLLFTIFNTSLLCPQNVSVKFQLRILNILFFISFWKCLVWVEAETGCCCTCLFKCKWAAAPRCFPRIGLCFTAPILC